MGEVLTWVDADGNETPLSTGDLKVLQGLQGRFMPPVTFSDDRMLGLAGARLRQIGFTPSEIAIPIRTRAASKADARLILRQWARRFDPTRGEGRLRCQVDDLPPRDLVCRYIGGLEGDEDEAASGGQQRFVAVFRAFDPYWRDTTPVVQLIDIAALAFLKDPWFDWQLVSSAALGQFVVDNDGDDDTWPLWTIQGPGGGAGTPVVLSNDTTGELIELDVTLAINQQIHIDTRPGAKTVTGPNGENLYTQLSDPSVLWPLVQGPQTVSVALPNAEAGQSNVRLEWWRRRLTA